MKNEIVILTDENFPYGGPGANYLRNLSKGIKLNSRYEVLVWLQSGNSRPEKEFKNVKLNSINGVNYKFIGACSLRPRSICGRIIDDLIGIINPVFLIIKKRKRLKVLIVYNNSSVKTLIPLVICKLFNIKTIKILPEWYEKGAVLTSKIKYIKWWDFIFGMTKQNFQYDGLIVLSSYLKNYYTTNGYPEKKLIVLPNLVNLDEFVAVYQRRKLETIIIGYSGTPVKKDGILDLLKAYSLLIKRHQNVELRIIGDISQTRTAIPFLKVKAGEYGIFENQIHFTGLVDFKEVPGILNSCDILVFTRPSGQFAEAGFPTKLGEYLACNKPVVMTKVGDIPKYFTDKWNAILVEPDNPESIFDGLDFLIKNPIKAKEIAEEGNKWVQENLEYKNATVKIVEFIESALQ
jgi:glycosyltransferase involved in cell wall biosynthesis